MSGRHFERGTTIVETALVMGVMLIVLFGIMDFGRLMYTYHLVNNAARLGTRFAIVRGSECVHYVSGGGDAWPCPATQSAAISEIQNYVVAQSVTMGLGTFPTANVSPTWNHVEGCAPPQVGVTTYNNMPGCQVVVTVTYPYHFFLPYMPGTTVYLSSTSKMLVSQ